MTIPQLRSRISCARASWSVRRRSRALIGTLVEASKHAPILYNLLDRTRGHRVGLSVDTAEEAYIIYYISGNGAYGSSQNCSTRSSWPPPTTHLPPPQICHARSMARPSSWRWLCDYLFSRYDVSALQALYKLSSDIMRVTELSDDVYNLLWSAVDGRLSW